MTSSNGNISAIPALSEGNPPVTGEFSSQRSSDAEMSPFDDVITFFVRFHANCAIQDADVGVNDIEKMPYLDMCVQESLRLHPIGAMWVIDNTDVCRSY